MASKPTSTELKRRNLIHHPKSPTASLESLRALAGIIKLERPVEMTCLFDDCGDPKCRDSD